MTDAAEAEPPADKARRATLSRLSRIEGQVRGVARMVEQERYCVDVLAQLAAIKSAINGVEREVLRTHARTCLAAARRAGDRDELRDKVEELLDLLSRHYKL